MPPLALALPHGPRLEYLGLADTLGPEERSRRMAAVKDKHSKPEMKLRSLVHRMGYRYRLHGRGLPGKPDMVFSSRKAVIFMHGCFWHRHRNCPLARMPKSRVAFWSKKLEENRKRDGRVRYKLRKMGWRVLVIWECQLRDPEKVARRVEAFLAQCKLEEDR